VKEVSVRNLCRNGREILDAVIRGESMTVTRHGRAIAELRPLRDPGVRIETLQNAFKHCPHVSHDELRTDMAEFLNLSL
jgi:antitoxin (DNA-binding transcriptional repressor) of toxin-antitoxin stability system